MAGNIQSVSFTSPQALIAPDLVAQQQQLARNQALADALRQQSLTDVPTNQGAVSWTQGIAKIAQALAAKKLYNRSDAQTANLSQQYAARMGAQFGHAGGAPAAGAAPQGAAPGAVPPASADGSAPPAAPAGNPQLAAAVRSAAGIPATPSPTPSMPDDGASGTPNASVPDQPSSPAGSPAPVGAPAAAVSSPSPSPQGWVPGPMSLSGGPGDMALWAQNPEEYSKAVIAAHAPVEMARTLQQAQAAAANGDYLTASNLYANIHKQNYIAPLDGRPGTVVRDPSNPQQIMAVNPQSIEGANPEIVNGQWTGRYVQAPGAAPAIAAVAGAKAQGAATGSLTQRWNPVTQQMEYVSTASMLPNGGGGGSPAPTAAPNGAPAAGGGLNGLFGGGAGGGAPAGGGNAAGPPIGAPQAANTAAQNSANQFNATIGSAQSSQDRGYGLQRIGDLAKGLPTGAGAADISNLKSGANSVLGAVGIGPVFDNTAIAKTQEIQKLASSLAQQQSSALGGNGATDAKLSAAFASLPDANKAPQAIRDITTYLGANERAIQGKGQAAAAWQQQHGPGTYSDFAASWQRAYDPRIYQWMQQGPQAVKQGLASLPPAERQQLIAKSNALAQMGALGQ